jgi:4a-hydroxytetrahydrobiopterin dehydratase
MAALLSMEEVAAGLAELDGWSGDATGITRTAKLPSFLSAIAVVDQVAVVAEEMDHHPDIDIRFRTLTFANVTHAAGGLTNLDLELAHRIDAIIATATAG